MCYKERVGGRERDQSESFMIYVGFSHLKSGFELFFNEAVSTLDLISIQFVLIYQYRTCDLYINRPLKNNL